MKELKDVLDDHLGHEGASIYPRLMLAGASSTQAVRQFEAEFDTLRADWGVYLEDWNAECLAVDWDSFQYETIDLMTRMRARTRQETGILYPLALKTGAIALR